jgi:argininosuccinate lyase
MAKKLWGGRFKKPIDPVFERFSSSMAVDYRLAKFDLIGSYLHVHVLKGAGLLSSPECAKLKKGIGDLIALVDKGSFAYNFSEEDIHTNIQNELAKKAPDAAVKLQTCRSRNDQVVFATKLYCLFHGTQVRELIYEVQKSLHKLGGLYDKLVIPGYTHLQHAQPVLFKDYVGAHAAMLGRDADRLESSIKRLDITMGSGALAGTPIPASVYRTEMKRALKSLGLEALVVFIGTAKSALATVSDRDFAIELLSTLAIIGMHLSRLAEDLILWSTKEFGFIEVGDEFCTGSSLMPQKKNPDALELIRGASGIFAGNLVSLLTVMKGLPLSYNRDMQWDKAPLLGSINLAKEVLFITAGLLKTIKVHKDRIAAQLEDESLYATDLADYLVGNGVVFSQAHEIVGKLIQYVFDKQVKIRDMSQGEFDLFSKKLIKKEVVKRLNSSFSVSSKKSF